MRTWLPYVVIVVLLCALSSPTYSGIPPKQEFMFKTHECQASFCQKTLDKCIEILRNMGPLYYDPRGQR